MKEGERRGEERGKGGRDSPKIHLHRTSQMLSVLVLCAAVSNRRTAKLEEAIPCVSSLQSYVSASVVYIKWGACRLVMQGDGYFRGAVFNS